MGWQAAADTFGGTTVQPDTVTLDESTTIHVWDSSAEQRYMVLPERPRGTEALSEDELAKLVTRDAMIGVAKVGG